MESYPQIEGGVYHSQVQAFAEIHRVVAEHKQRIDIELAVIKHHYDVTASDQAQSDSREEPYDTVRETLRLVTHVRRHDITTLKDACENRDHTDTLQYLTRATMDRLAIIRERIADVETIDHDTVARTAATLNSELVADYRKIVDGLHTRYTGLEKDLLSLARLVAGAIDTDVASGTGAASSDPLCTSET